jgi:uncharacterized transporter YbjL
MSADRKRVVFNLVCLWLSATGLVAEGGWIWSRQWTAGLAVMVLGALIAGISLACAFMLGRAIKETTETGGGGKGEPHERRPQD